MSKIIDLSWGDPIVVRQALSEELGDSLLPQNLFPVAEVGYPPHEGLPELIELLKDMAYLQCGFRPKHLVVTCGATGAINASLYALKDANTEYVIKNKRCFPFYSGIIRSHSLIDLSKERSEKFILRGVPNSHFITLTDSPSNPEGLVDPYVNTDIWDAAYGSAIYGGEPALSPMSWCIMCGSLSKSLGLAGLRIGWAATNDDEVAHSLLEYVTLQTAGLSIQSQTTAISVLKSVNHISFGIRASSYLNDNREEAQKLLTMFGQGEVPARGMFFLVQLGAIERKALEKANIKWQPGSVWGEDDSWARLSLGQSRELVKLAVRTALK